MSRRPIRWDLEVLFTSGDAYFSGVLKAVDEAKASIDLETYIFERGVLADRLTERLILASLRGVRVRIIVDGLGSPGFVGQYWPSLKKNGIRVRFFRLSPWLWRRFPGDPEGFRARMQSRLRKLNHGIHRKYFLIDEAELWIGSFNISDVHLREVSGNEAWKDVGVKVCGAELKYVKRAFKRAYRGWTALNWPLLGRSRLLLLNDSFLHTRRSRQAQLTRLRKARSRIWLATPYFVPIGRLIRVLAARAKDGVDVRVMVPTRTDVWFMRWMSLPLLNSLAKRGVKVFLYSRGFSHQKVFVCDDWICIGSTNLNHRSFLHDLEIDVVVTHEANKNTIIDNYLRDQEASEPLNLSQWEKFPWWKRLLSSIFLFVKYWS